ncbi:MAG: hypothetical protein K1X39_06465 [Thermoflexales bacterium]|nr:hypothetical protein [Thermoflexales bacterium]
MATLCIFNPNANRGRLTGSAQTMQALAAAAPDTAWSVTTSPRHATSLAAQAAAAGFDVIVAIGGDGTVHETVNGLMSTPAATRPTLGVVAFGSGNDFALNMGLPTEPVEAMKACLAAIAGGKKRAVDVAWVRDESGRREYWDNTLGIGFDAAVGLSTKRYSFTTGFPMYLLATIDTIARNFAPTAMQLDVDGNVRAERALMLTLGNGPREGGGFHTTPGSRIDDGRLEYCLARPMPRPRMLQILPDFQKGTHGKHKVEVELGSFTHLKVKWDRSLPIHTDGETFADFGSPIRSIEVGIEAGALQVVAAPKA